MEQNLPVWCKSSCFQVQIAISVETFSRSPVIVCHQRKQFPKRRNSLPLLVQQRFGEILFISFSLKRLTAEACMKCALQRLDCAGIRSPRICSNKPSTQGVAPTMQIRCSHAKLRISSVHGKNRLQKYALRSLWLHAIDSKDNQFLNARRLCLDEAGLLLQVGHQG